MEKAKKIFVLVAAFVMGAGFLVYGIGLWRDSLRLASEGKATEGKVVDDEIHRARRGRKTYYLMVEFRTEASQSITKRIQVDSDTHKAGVSAGTVLVHYLPNAPEICQAGAEVETKWGMAATGAGLLALGLFLVYSRKRPTSRKELADKVEAGLEQLCQTEAQYVPVQAQQFKGLDLAFYDEAQRRFEARGFTYLEDIEVVMPKPNKNFERTFMRVMLSRDGTGVATCFHLRPAWALRAIGAKELKGYGIDTQFSNETFVTTSNAETVGALDQPPACNECHVPKSTPIELVIDAHEKRVDQHAASHPESGPVRMLTAADVHQAMALQQRIKGEFRKKAGLSKAELEKLGGSSNNKVINDLCEDLKERKKAA
jgi:hypothetical protein